jgi:sugar lactone lactonase YvrE
MHSFERRNSKTLAKRLAGFVYLILVVFGLAAGSEIHAQVTSVPPVVFSSSSLLGPTSGGGSASRIAANQRGDVFTNITGGNGSLVEIPAGTNTQVVLATNLKTDDGYGSVTVDSYGNIWFLAQAPDGYDDGVDVIPFVNGTYATGLNLASTPLPPCSIPIYPVAAPCVYPNIDASSFGGAYTLLSDLAVDPVGNLYALSWVNCFISCTNDTYASIVEYSAATGKPQVVVNNNLPVLYPGSYYENNYEQFVLAPNGDFYYVNGINLYYSAAGSGTVSTVAGFNAPSGISIDGGGNVYVADSGNNRIAVLPSINGVVTPSSAYTILSGSVLNEAPYFSVGIDGYGTITYPATYNANSFYRASVGGLNFGSLNVGSSSAATELDLYFTAAETFGSVTLTGAGAPFAAVSAATNGCVVGQSYAVGDTCSLSVTYKPSAAGPQSGTLEVYSKTGTLLGTAALSGSGIAPLLNVDPGTVTSIGATASWKAPSAVAVDGAGNTYVADSTTGNIYKNGNATAIASGFSSPSSIAVDSAGNLYVGDSGNNRIVEISYSGTAYGTPAVIKTGLSGPTGLALDAAGNLYVADSGNKRVLLLATGGGLPAGSNTSALGTSVTSTGTASTGFTDPVDVAVDGLGNVYVADSGSIIQVDIQSGITKPVVQGLGVAAGVAVDAGGNLYYADAGTNTITRVPNVGGTLNTSDALVLGTIVAKPVAIAVDSFGNVYAADTSDATVGEMNRNSATLAFGPVVEGKASETLSETLSNGGDASLALGTPYYTASGSNTADFAVQSNSTCASGASLAVGGSCTIANVFTPSTEGAESETLTVASNSGTIPLSLTGTGETEVDVTITGPTTTVYGTKPSYAVTATKDGTYTVNISGTAIASTTVVVTGGTGSFSIPVVGVGNYTLALAGTVGSASVAVTPAPLYGTAVSVSRVYGSANPVFQATITGAVNNDTFSGGGTTTATTLSNAGTYPIVPTATGPEIANYTFIPTDGVLTITQAASNSALVITTADGGLQGTPVTLTANVTSSTPGQPTGTVTFENVTASNNIVTIGTATLSKGVATLTSSSLAPGTIYIAAVYNGDINFLTSTSAATGLTITLPTFTLASTPQTLTVVQGQSGSVQLTVAPVGNFTSPVTFSCQGMPLEATCSFANPSVTPNGGPVTTTLTVNTVGPISASLNRSAPWKDMGAGTVLALTGGLFIGWRRKRFTKGLCVFVLLAIVGLIPMTGCGLNEKPFDTPLGISTVTITGSSSVNTTQVSTELRLAVTSK